MGTTRLFVIILMILMRRGCNLSNVLHQQDPQCFDKLNERCLTLAEKVADQDQDMSERSGGDQRSPISERSLRLR